MKITSGRRAGQSGTRAAAYHYQEAPQPGTRGLDDRQLARGTRGRPTQAHDGPEQGETLSASYGREMDFFFFFSKLQEENLGICYAILTLLEAHAEMLRLPPGRKEGN